MLHDSNFRLNSTTYSLFISRFSRSRIISQLSIPATPTPRFHQPKPITNNQSTIQPLTGSPSPNGPESLKLPTLHERKIHQLFTPAS